MLTVKGGMTTAFVRYNSTEVVVVAMLFVELMATSVSRVGVDTVVMSNGVHGYVSQSDKGELVIGAGIDSYNGYGQRGSFDTIEHTMQAIIELFPAFSRVRMLRQWGGMCGFPDPNESPYDTVKTGHGGTSISTAMGIALGWRGKPEDDCRKAVAVIGDGSLQEGNAYEALNHGAGT